MGGQVTARRLMTIAALGELGGHIPYAVVRNVDRLHCGVFGDVDLVVPPGTSGRAAEILVRSFIGEGWVLVREVSRPYLRGLVFCGPGLPPSANPFVAIDVFDGTTWHGFPYMDSLLLLERRECSSGVMTLAPPYDALVTLFHYLLYSRDVPLRYRMWIRTAVSGGVDDMRVFPSPIRSVANHVLGLVSGEKWSEAAEASRQLRTMVVLAAVRHRAVTRMLRSGARALGSFVADVANPRGVLLWGLDPVTARDWLNAAVRSHVFSATKSALVEGRVRDLPGIWYRVARDGLVVSQSPPQLAQLLRAVGVRIFQAPIADDGLPEAQLARALLVQLSGFEPESSGRGAVRGEKP